MNDVIEQNTPQDDNNRNYMMIIYGLYALSLVTAGCAALIGVILAYVKRDDMRGTIYENHITYLIKTFKPSGYRWPQAWSARVPPLSSSVS